jgi:RNA polymerase sigma-54 factor
MDPKLHLSPERRLIMTLALRQSQEILQMTQQELAQYLQTQIEKNPLLELNPPKAKKRFDFDVPATPTLREHLLAQIRENFPCPIDRMVAEEFLEHLDEKGFLTSVPENQERVLSILQTFDPPGIFARNLQESLLLQLKAKRKTQSAAYTLVASHFEDLLHGRYALIKKGLKLSDLSGVIQELAHLSIRPAHAFLHEPACPIQPDLRIMKQETSWIVELIEEDLPSFHLQTDYLSLKPDHAEEKASLREFKSEADALIRSLSRRKKLLLEIGKILLKKQLAYLDQKGPLVAFTAKELAEQLSIHESTLSRALSGKYVSTPRGLLPLKALLTATPAKATALETLRSLIEGEDKGDPFTDEALAQALQAKGYLAARRTIAKYRAQLKIGPASQRKNTGISN